MSKYKIRIKISDIQVSSKYFSFNFKMSINGTPSEGTYSDSHNWVVEKEFQKFLKKGYAEELILSDIDWYEVIKPEWNPASLRNVKCTVAYRVAKKYLKED